MTYDAPALFDQSEQSLLYKHKKPHPLQAMTYDVPALFDQSVQSSLFKHKKPHPSISWRMMFQLCLTNWNNSYFFVEVSLNPFCVATLIF